MIPDLLHQAAQGTSCPHDPPCPTVPLITNFDAIPGAFWPTPTRLDIGALHEALCDGAQIPGARLLRRCVAVHIGCEECAS